MTEMKLTAIYNPIQITIIYGSKKGKKLGLEKMISISIPMVARVITHINSFRFKLNLFRLSLIFQEHSVAQLPLTVDC